MKSNFYYSFLLLPPKEKQAITRFYSFCREIDDQIDTQSLSIPEKLTLVQNWRDELNQTYRGNPRDPLTQDLYPIIQKYHISKNHLDEIINGMEMDLLSPTYQTFEELKLYCYRVASAVGLVCLEIFNDRSDISREMAIHLGIAFQLTNIIRDIFVDLDRGRIYLPSEDFGKFGYTEQNLKNRTINVEFSNLIQFEIDRARVYYEKAETGIMLSNNIGTDVIKVMFKTYYQILSKLERNIWTLDKKTVSLSTLSKILIAGTVWIKKIGF